MHQGVVGSCHEQVGWRVVYSVSDEVSIYHMSDIYTGSFLEFDLLNSN
jgi:hypothetical protein